MAFNTSLWHYREKIPTVFHYASSASKIQFTHWEYISSVFFHSEVKHFLGYEIISNNFIIAKSNIFAFERNTSLCYKDCSRETCIGKQLNGAEPVSISPC